VSKLIGLLHSRRVDPALALLGQGLKKSPIWTKIGFCQSFLFMQRSQIGIGLYFFSKQPKFLLGLFAIWQ
jgi:hypothetical protein